MRKNKCIGGCDSLEPDMYNRNLEKFTYGFSGLPIIVNDDWTSNSAHKIKYDIGYPTIYDFLNLSENMSNIKHTTKL